MSQRKEYHAYDVLYHSLHAVEECERELPLRLAMLLHDVGKPAAQKDHGNMHGHETMGAELADAALTRLRCPNALRERVVLLIRWHMYDLRGNARERTLKKRFVSLGREVTRQLSYIREADVHGSGIITGEVASAARWRAVVAAMDAHNAPWNEAELECTGEDICAWLGIPPSKRVGEIKRALLMHCCCKSGDNTREKLRLLTLDMGR